MTRVGAIYEGKGKCRFEVWAPLSPDVALRLVGRDTRELPMARNDQGCWHVELQDISPGTRYGYVLRGGLLRPDPASDFQPEGVHGPSEVVDHSDFEWTDTGWEGVPLENMVIYELHVGTFTPVGTFEAILPRLAELRDLGITAIELMPVAQFPGARNWGYDGVHPYAVQNSYGGPHGLKMLVNAIHRHGMSAILDVVYNHLGPEGNYLRDFGPYFTDIYKTPWGEALNFDGAESHHVRDYFIENAVYWFRDYHFDALRLDALHAIYDRSAKHFIRELVERVASYSRQSGRKCYLIGESDLNDTRLIKPVRSGGYGLDAQWADDFHHSLHTLLTGEQSGYYEDFGRIDQLVKAYREGFVYSWQHSKHRRRRHGSSSKSLPARQFVVCAQNHDQIGNRMLGERLSELLDLESLKLAAGALLLSPYVPLLFMGEEYGEDARFQYFVSHTDQALIQAVREGRRNEFRAFAWSQEVPDPQAVETFESSKLRWKTRAEGHRHILLEFYRRLFVVRRSIPLVVSKGNTTVRCLEKEQVLTWRRAYPDRGIHCLMNFSRASARFCLNAREGRWTRVLDSAGLQWDGPGSTLPENPAGKENVTMPPRSIALFQTESPRTAQEQRAARTTVVAVEE
ncbi:MAG: malto-oligosyltrehalose trehalohydrolase [Sedimentisphaerales bacterium]|nr:malto-oligosyltrehalose trehalohydrolase [Sedimentisphaerales bacterium]